MKIQWLVTYHSGSNCIIKKKVFDDILEANTFHKNQLDNHICDNHCKISIIVS